VDVSLATTDYHVLRQQLTNRSHTLHLLTNMMPVEIGVRIGLDVLEDPSGNCWYL